MRRSHIVGTGGRGLPDPTDPTAYYKTSEREPSGLLVNIVSAVVVIAIFASLGSLAWSIFGRGSLVGSVQQKVSPAPGASQIDKVKLNKLDQQVAQQQREITALREKLRVMQTSGQPVSASPSAEIAALRGDLEKLRALPPNADVAALRGDFEKLRGLISDRPEDILSNLRVRSELTGLREQVDALRADVKRSNDSNLTIGFSMAGLVVAIIGILITTLLGRRGEVTPRR